MTHTALPRFALTLALTLALASAFACGDDPTRASGLRPLPVTTAVDGAALVVQNNNDVAIRVALIERVWGETALAQWCFGSAECGTALEPGAEVRVPLMDVEGYRADMSEVLVHWWKPSAANDEGTSTVTTYALTLN